MAVGIFLDSQLSNSRLNSRNTKLTRTINTQLYTKKNMLSPKEQDDNIHHILIFTSL